MSMSILSRQPQRDRAYQQRDEDQQGGRQGFHLSVFLRRCTCLYGGSVERKTSGGAGLLNSLRHVTAMGLRITASSFFYLFDCSIRRHNV